MAFRKQQKLCSILFAPTPLQQAFVFQRSCLRKTASWAVAGFWLKVFRLCHWKKSMERKQWKFSFSCLIETAKVVWVFWRERQGRKYSLSILNNCFTTHFAQMGPWRWAGWVVRGTGCKEKQCNLLHVFNNNMTLWYYICTNVLLCLHGKVVATYACVAHLHIRAICEPFPQPIYSLPRDLAEFCNLREVWLVRCSIKWNWFVLQPDWWEDQSLGIK